jgi:methyl-accepting chemotaxis protein
MVRRFLNGRNLSQQATMLMAAVVLCVALTLFGTSSVLLSTRFGDLERRDTTQNAQRALEALSAQVAALNSKGSDWANWDDLYGFMERGDQAFVDANMSNSALSGMKLNVMLFVNNAGKLMAGKAYDFAAQQPVTVPASLTALMQDQANLLWQHPDLTKSTAGILMLPEGPMLIVSRPILTSDAEGPSHGTLLWGRYLDDALVQELAGTTHLSLHLYGVADANLPADSAAALRQLSAQTPVTTRVLDGQTVAGYGLIQDVYGKPALIMRADMPRTIVQEGQQTVHYFTLLLLVICGLLGAVVVWLLRRVILQPLARLVVVADRLAEGRLDVTLEDAARGDEIGRLARAIDSVAGYLHGTSDHALALAHGNLTIDVTPRSDGDVLSHAFAQMVGSLRDLVGEIGESSHSLNDASVQLTVGARENGSASEQITAAARDEGQTSRDMLAATAQVRAAIEQIANSVQQVAMGTTQQAQSMSAAMAQVQHLATITEAIVAGGQQQAEALRKSKHNTDQMAVAVQASVENAEAGAHHSAQSAETAQAGAETVRRVVDGMGAIQAAVTDAARKVQQMQRHSGQIGEIVKTIENIAEQTNLLALNAAIEAARAGEQGRGFAVVAEEVRKLADQTGRATKEIAQLVQTVQNGTQEAVAAMQASMGEVSQGTNLANQAGSALQQILGSGRQVAGETQGILDSMRAIAEASRLLQAEMDQISGVVRSNESATVQLTAVSGEIGAAIETIAGISQENSAMAEEVSATTQEMSAQVEDLSAAAHKTTTQAESLEISAEDMSARAEDVEAQAQALNEMSLLLDQLVDRFELGTAPAPMRVPAPHRSIGVDVREAEPVMALPNL